MILRKILKFFCVVVLIWLVAVLSVLRRHSMLNSVDNPYKDKDLFVNKDLCKFGRCVFKSNFNAWDMLPKPGGLSNDRRYLIRKYDVYPGKDGKKVVLRRGLGGKTNHEIGKGWDQYAFNAYVSDLIPLKRSLPDVRDARCKSKNYSDSLPKASVVICFYNEAWSTLLRTVHSVINRSPDNLLVEIIMVDDGSTMPHLNTSLSDYLSKITRTKLIRIKTREGLVNARLRGLEHVNTPIVVFLDSHCECAKGWLEPLLHRIAADNTVIASPVVDHIDDDTFEYISQNRHDIRIGGFTWDLKFQWISIPYSVKAKINDPTDPIKTPTISGGLFAINVEFFKHLRLYDEGFSMWGSENLELSFKAWMCGGSLEIVPCSHVGHVFRVRFPYEMPAGVMTQNALRLAEVWMDDYAKYFYQRIGLQKGYSGDVSERKMIRQTLKCKSFEWYLKNIYPQLIVPDNSVAAGEIMSLNDYEMCLDAGSFIKGAVLVTPCHGQGGNQFWLYSKNGDIGRDDLCLEYTLIHKDIKFSSCKNERDIWVFDNKTQNIVHWYTKNCLTMNRNIVTLEPCQHPHKQKWSMENYRSDKMSSLLQKYLCLYRNYTETILSQE